MPRNRLLADAFYRARLIERWGTGTLRIVRECEAAGMARPEFLSDMGTFIVRFPGLHEAPGGSSKLAARTGRVLDYLREHDSITAREYAELSGLSRRQAQLDLKRLANEGILEVRGGGHTVHYVPGSPADRA